MSEAADYWQTAHDAALAGDLGTASRFAHLAIRVGCGNECVTPGAKRPGGQQVNGGCRCKEMLLSVMRAIPSPGTTPSPSREDGLREAAAAMCAECRDGDVAVLVEPDVVPRDRYAHRAPNGDMYGCDASAILALINKEPRS